MVRYKWQYAQPYPMLLCNMWFKIKHLPLCREDQTRELLFVIGKLLINNKTFCRNLMINYGA
jgi:hypothetical protein